MVRNIIEITNGVTRHPDYRLAQPLNLSLKADEPVAICGVNGGGKSLFVDVLTGAHPLLGDAIKYDFGPNALSKRCSDNIRLVTFRDVYGGNEPAYYQQRWNQADEQIFPTVEELLNRSLETYAASSVLPNDELLKQSAELLKELGVEAYLQKPINKLSSGELRRMQLARTLVSCPQMLIIDNPYIGLDVAAREMLTRVLERLSQSLTLVLVVSRVEDIPDFVQTIIPVGCKKVFSPCEASVYKEKTTKHGAYNDENAEEDADCSVYKKNDSDSVLVLPERSHPVAVAEGESVIDFRNITIRYGERTILKDLTWNVKRGEHWALMGQNGSGKSTLLSLVCADNPQGYACDIRLFGHQRGKGESIWDIKKHIGYVSPEIYSTYRKQLSALDIVASGLRDTIGLYHQPTEADRQHCMQWLRVFGCEHLAAHSYLTLSSGEQRLVLLVRAFVKHPDLLILDEPFHGLDNLYRHRAMQVIDAYMNDPAKTLIMVTHYEEELPQCIDHRLTLIRN